jgi:hypothetical protein
MIGAWRQHEVGGAKMMSLGDVMVIALAIVAIGGKYIGE